MPASVACADAEPCCLTSMEFTQEPKFSESQNLSQLGHLRSSAAIRFSHRFREHLSLNFIHVGGNTT